MNSIILCSDKHKFTLQLISVEPILNDKGIVDTAFGYILCEYCGVLLKREVQRS